MAEWREEEFELDVDIELSLLQSFTDGGDGEWDEDAGSWAFRRSLEGALKKEFPAATVNVSVTSQSTWGASDTITVTYPIDEDDAEDEAEDEEEDEETRMRRLSDESDSVDKVKTLVSDYTRTIIDQVYEDPSWLIRKNEGDEDEDED